MSIVVIDPGHGGMQTIPNDSSSNNAESPSGALEKDICLNLAQRIRWSLLNGSAKSYADAQGKQVEVYLTRSSDVNLKLADRAGVAAACQADLFISIHCNGNEDNPGRGVRGIEAYIDRKYREPTHETSAGKTVRQDGPGKPNSGIRNANYLRDAEFASAAVAAVHQAWKQFDAGAKIRSDRYTTARNGEVYAPPAGVKMKGLSVLEDVHLGTAANDCRACLIEIEFIDHLTVDNLINGARAEDVRNALAAALARCIVDFS